jgi:hypothetical protein
MCFRQLDVASSHVGTNQGDQMSWWKNARNVAQHIFDPKKKTALIVEKVAHKFWLLLQFSDTYVTAECKQPMLGENSPNLVTLVQTY